MLFRAFGTNRRHNKGGVGMNGKRSGLRIEGLHSTLVITIIALESSHRDLALLEIAMDDIDGVLS